MRLYNGKIDGNGKKLDDMGIKASKLGWVQYTTGYDFGIAESRQKGKWNCIRKHSQFIWRIFDK